MRATHLWAIAAVAMASIPAARGAVLPDDRADVLYHRYDGGGVTVEGPSMLVRKKIGDQVSVSANYYVDMVSSASIDVMTTASPYKEKRTQGTLGIDILNGNTQYSFGYILSDEPDYTANTASFDVSQSMFGDLTTVSFGFSQGWDDIRKHGDPTFSKSATHHDYRFGLTQILTSRLMMGLNYEIVSDEGFLNNPYRSVRYLDPEVPKGYAYQPEVYPHTRTGNAVALDARYFLPFRAALHGNYRYYKDTWGIAANTIEIGYTQPWHRQWIFEVGYRWYGQSAATFYSDLFPRANAQNFMARDKELATFTSQGLSLRATYDLPRLGWKFPERSTLNFFYDHIHYSYADFRNLLEPGTPGTEPLYHFDADVFQLFYSGWF